MKQRYTFTLFNSADCELASDTVEGSERKAQYALAAFVLTLVPSDGDRIVINVEESNNG